MTTTASTFHPMEIFFCGHSGRGKTHLITRLIKRMSARYDIGYIKHDAHSFNMDRDGKDTAKATAAGAVQISINSPTDTAHTKMAILSSHIKDSEMAIRQNYLNCDVVIVEGYKNKNCPKILLWEDCARDNDLLNHCKREGLLAVVGASEVPPTDLNLPYFHRDNIEHIETFIENYWEDKIKHAPLYGLVLGGGHSKRMGRDKGTLKYHGIPQVEFLHKMLQEICEKSFVSCRPEQADLPHLSLIPKIEDRYIGFGPTGGILSAAHRYPQASWLVLACDMPNLDKDTVHCLVKNRNPYKIATCFFNEEKNWPEPLCAIYEPKAATVMGRYLISGKPCPRKILMKSNIKEIIHSGRDRLININTPKELKEIGVAI